MEGSREEKIINCGYLLGKGALIPEGIRGGARRKMKAHKERE